MEATATSTTAPRRSRPDKTTPRRLIPATHSAVEDPTRSGSRYPKLGIPSEASADYGDFRQPAHQTAPRRTQRDRRPPPSAAGAVNGQLFLPAGGQQNCPEVARNSARRAIGSVVSPLAGGGLGEADGVAGGEHDVGVVQEPVDRRVGDGLGHQLVEPGGVEASAGGLIVISAAGDCHVH